MIATAQQTQGPSRRPVEASARTPRKHSSGELGGADSIVAAVEPQTAHEVADRAAGLARTLGAPLVFVTVRPPPPALLGEPYRERQLTRDLIRSRKTLDVALAAASRYGVMSHGVILEGDGATEIAEFASARNAQLLVVGERCRDHDRHFRVSGYARLGCHNARWNDKHRAASNADQLS